MTLIANHVPIQIEHEFVYKYSDKSNFIFILLLSFLLNTMMAQNIYTEAYTDSLWNLTVQPYLTDPLWKTGSSYDAGHFLMLPMHAAFERNNAAWKNEFAQHFKRYSDSGISDMSKTLLYRIQYIYLASEFLVLCQQYKEDTLIPNALYQQLYTKIETTWKIDKVWNWPHPSYKRPTFKNMRKKVLWKLYNKVVKEKTYHTAIIDEEFFTICTAANLKRYLKGFSGSNDELLDDVVQIGNEAFQKRVEFSPNGGWVIQPGYWSNHPDFYYAGNDMVTDSLEINKVADIAEDFTHSLRYPAWINSMLNVFDSNSSNYIFYQKLKIGLSTQLLSTILLPPDDRFPQYRATNFMDGNNGVYRYKYSGRPGGTGPYELSNSFQIGWWSLLDSKRIGQVYESFVLQHALDEAKHANLYKNIDATTFKYLICILAMQRIPKFE